jgi:hypothetical protein
LFTVLSQTIHMHRVAPSLLPTNRQATRPSRVEWLDLS